MLQMVLVKHRAKDGLAWDNYFVAFNDFWSYVLENSVLLVFEL